jgi:peptidase M1-like protein
MRSARLTTALLPILVFARLCVGADTPSSPAMGLYRALKVFQLSGATLQAENLTLKRDRATMTFNGTFYFETPIEDKVYGAVFIGQGSFHADPPPTQFERELVRRVMNADSVDADFRTAVLRFTDDTSDLIRGGVGSGDVDKEAIKLANECEPLLLRQTGANISARLSTSILNGEKPGVFVAHFDKGKRGPFGFALDYQSRVPVATFELDAGEKGVIWNHDPAPFNEIWMAFYSLADYQRGMVQYSDTFDLVSVPQYTITVDATEPQKEITETVRMEMSALGDGLRAIPLMLNNTLPEGDNTRLKKALRLNAAKLSDGGILDAVQEDWDGGITLFLPKPKKAGDKFSVELSLQGKAMMHVEGGESGWGVESSSAQGECYYPLSTTDWYPRHSELKRSAFDLIFRYKDHTMVVAVGKRVREEAAPDEKSQLITEWKMDTPVALATFAVGHFRRDADVAKIGDHEVPVEFYQPNGASKADFMLAELGNCVRYFSAMFGPYPFQTFKGVFQPRGFGQGFPTLLLLARSDTATSRGFSFIAHETSHQWWGDVVTWRSYRDQWLSEGFANYSAILYTAFREDKKSAAELLRGYRRSLLLPPVTLTGVGKGRLEDIGPLVLGHRLDTSATLGAYQFLIYNKGALVLRMLHFLFTDPTSGDDQAFFNLMKDFVNSYAGRAASTSDFVSIVNQRISQTALGKRYNVTGLNWFFLQWVYGTGLPAYELDYNIQPQPDGSAVLQGTLSQDDVRDDWIMPLPMVMEFSKGRSAHGVVWAHGKQAAVKVHLSEQPTKVELDPEHWVLSSSTVTQREK